MMADGSAESIAALIRVVEFNGGLGDRIVSGKDGVSLRTGTLLAGLHAHAYALAEASVPLWVDEVLVVAARPVARSLFETGVIAQWVAHDPEASAALVAAYDEDQRKLAGSLRRAQRLAKLAPSVEARRPRVTSAKRGVAESFKNITDQFTDGEELYSYYRLLCGQTHAGVEVADQWLAGEEEGRAFSVLAVSAPPECRICQPSTHGAPVSRFCLRRQHLDDWRAERF